MRSITSIRNPDRGIPTRFTAFVKYMYFIKSDRYVILVSYKDKVFGIFFPERLMFGRGEESTVMYQPGRIFLHEVIPV